MSKDLVSIITPCYNCSLTVVNTVQSIQAQTYKNWELIICDDFSSDDSVKLLNKLSHEDPRIKVYRLESNQGAGIARNYAINQAKGRYIAFCDSDDIWYPNKLCVQLELMAKYNLALTYSSYDIKRNDVYIDTKTVSPQISYIGLLLFNQLGCLTVVYDSSILGKRLMPEMRKRQDYALWLTILKEIKVTKGIVNSLAAYTIRSGSISSKKMNLLQYNYRVYRLLGYSRIWSFNLLLLFLIIYFFNKLISWVKRQQVSGGTSQF